MTDSNLPRTRDPRELPTLEDLSELRDEAAVAGDLAQVELCDLALAGDSGALLECARVIQAAEAMIDEETEIRVGDRVEAGEDGAEDHDTGWVHAIRGDTAVVGWDSGVATPIDLADLRRI